MSGTFSTVPHLLLEEGAYSGSAAVTHLLSDNLKEMANYYFG